MTTASLAVAQAAGPRNPGPAAEAARRPRRLSRELLGWAAIVVLALVLWPSNWGGLTGLTTVNGHSMDPTFASSDLVVSIKQPGYGVGDIISYEIPADEFGAGHRVVHRVFAIDDHDGTVRYLTKGDNNADIDDWRPAAGDVLGRVVLRLPYFGQLLSPAWLPYEAGAVAGLLVIILCWPRRRGERPARSREGSSA